MKYPLTALLLVAAIAGCSRPSNPDTAALRDQLAVANTKIAELEAQLARQPKAAQENGAKPRLEVIRGQRPNWKYPIFEGQNVIGRADDKPVEIDLEPQEPADRVWSSRQHALITCKAGAMVIEDLNSSNGTYVNRARVPPGEKKLLRKDDIIQIGEVQMKVLE